MRPRHTPPPRWWAHPDTWLWAAGSLTFLSAYMGVAYGSVHALALPADDHGAATPQAVATDWTWDTTSAPMTTVATTPSSVSTSAVVSARVSVSRACRCAPRRAPQTAIAAPTVPPQAPASTATHTHARSSVTDAIQRPQDDPQHAADQHKADDDVACKQRAEHHGDNPRRGHADHVPGQRHHHSSDQRGDDTMTLDESRMRDPWQNRAPAMLRSMNGPDGEPCPTPLDRRWLWRIEQFLAVYGTNDAQRAMSRDLRDYLFETCDHVWRDEEPEDDIPAHRQCLWCNDVQWINVRCSCGGEWPCGGPGWMGDHSPVSEP